MSIVQFSFSYLFIVRRCHIVFKYKKRDTTGKELSLSSLLWRCWCVRTNNSRNVYLITHNVEEVFILSFASICFVCSFWWKICLRGGGLAWRMKWTSNSPSLLMPLYTTDSITEVKLEMITNTKRNDGKRKQWQVGFTPTPPPAALVLYLWF